MLKSIKYELNPTKSQSKKLNQSFGNCRFVYNWALDKKIKAYQEEGKKLSCFDLMKELTQLKKKEEFKIAKNDIKEIKKNRNGATIALVGGGVAVIGFTWIMVNVMKDIGKVTGAVLGGNR